MANDIIRIGNDLNKVSWGDLTAIEQNLLMELLFKISFTDGEIYLTKAQLKALFKRSGRNHDSDVLKVLQGLEKKFFTLHFEQILGPIHRFINLFRTMEWSEDELFLRLEVEPQLKHLILNVTKHFTQLELADYLSLHNKYSKTLYRLLKQYRTTGEWIVDLEQFRTLLEVPSSYKLTNIDQRIIKPALDELSWGGGMRDIVKDATSPLYEHHAERPIFKNLKCEKIKNKSARGRGGKVTRFRFTWDREQPPQNYEQNLENYLKTPRAEGVNQVPVVTDPTNTEIPIAEGTKVGTVVQDMSGKEFVLTGWEGKKPILVPLLR